MKKLCCLFLALLMVLTAASAFAAGYQQHLANESTFASLEAARAAESDEMAELTPGRTYMPDPALDTYPEGTTWVYRSAGIYTPLSAAPRMNTNFLVYTEEMFEDEGAAYAYLKDLGLIDLCDAAVGSIVLVSPITPVGQDSNGARTGGFGQADQYAYFLLQSAMCNIGGSTGGNPATYYADSVYYGGLTYRYLIGIGGGATFINDYIAGALDDISRIAGLFLYDGKMADISKVADRVPTYLVNASEKTIAKYAAANECDAYGEEDGVQIYFNQARPQQAVRAAQADQLTADMLSDVFYSFLSHAMRVPVLKAGQNNANMLFADYNWNAAPYTLSVRVPIFNGRTQTGLVLSEHHGTEFSEDESYWYELVPEEVIDGTAPEHSVVLWVSNHGGGDDTVQYMDEIGLIELASNERQAIIGGQNLANPEMVTYMLEKYPALDPSRVYTQGYSMGGGNTLNIIQKKPAYFAAAVPMAAVFYNVTEEEKAQFEKVDLPVMLLTSTYDYFFEWENFTWRVNAGMNYPQNLNDFLSYNEMDGIESFDMEAYPFHGFKSDTYRRITLNGEYTNHTWFLKNKAGVPMVGLTVTEFLPHGLYPEYTKLAWDYVKHFSRNQETGEIIYNPYAE